MADLPVFDLNKSLYLPNHGEHFLFEGKEVVLDVDHDAEQAHLTDTSGALLLEETYRFTDHISRYRLHHLTERLVNKIMATTALAMFLDELDYCGT